MNAEWKSGTKYVIGIALAVFILYGIYISRSIVYLVAGAALISFVLRPLIGFFIRRLRFPRMAAVLTSHLLGGLVLILAPLVLLPPILDAVSVLLEVDYQAIIDNSLEWLETTLIFWKESGLNILGVRLVLDGFIDPALAYLQGVSPAFKPEIPAYDLVLNSLTSAFTVSFGLAVSLVGGVLSGLVAILFLTLASIYISIDGPKFYRNFLDLFPETQRPEVAKLNKRIRKTWDAFFRGQLALMVIIGLTVWLGLTILGVPGAFALALIAGLFEIIPSIGPILATIPAVLVALIQGSSHFDINHLAFALIVLGFYVLVQVFENYFVVPQVLGGAVKLHPLVVMAGVLIGYTVWGILGALLAAPIIATIKEIIEYLHRKLLGREPFPEDTIPIGQEISWVESVKLLVLRGQRFAQDKIPLPTPSEETLPVDPTDREETEE